MIVFPHAKINLGLYVTGKRPDGFHDLETCFVPVNIQDALEIVPATPGQDTSFTSSGLPIPGDPEQNLCVRAFRMLQQDFPLPQVQIHLHKAIPMGAGLGGGSSDAAFVLTTLNRLFHLELSQETLTGYASRLGSDCAFFLQTKACIGRGKGDILSPSDLSLSGFQLVVIKPPVGVNTAEAYQNIIPAQPGTPVAEQLKEPIECWRDCLFNDFEKTVFPKYPEIARIKDELYNLGAVYAAMTGSGSAVYGLFKRPDPQGTSHPTEFKFLNSEFNGSQVFVDKLTESKILNLES